MNPTGALRSVAWFFSALVFCFSPPALRAQGLSPYGPPTGPQVQLDIFSGVPNPVVEISADDMARLRGLVEKLPLDASVTKEDVHPQRTGYRGFRVGLILGPNPTYVSGMPSEFQTIKVYGQFVEVRTFRPATGSESTAVLKFDAARSVETELKNLLLAKASLAPETVSLITAQIQAIKMRK